MPDRDGAMTMDEIWAAWQVDRNRIAELEAKAAAYDAMCEVGLIQFDEGVPKPTYSVWGFGAWHHDKDILKAIAAAMEPPTLGALEQEQGGE